MKIIVGSLSALDGVGHTTRISNILDSLQKIYGSENIEWIHIVPGRIRSLLGFSKLKREFSSKKYRVTLIPFFQLPVVYFLYSWMLSIWIWIYLAIRYRNTKDLMLWVEMSPSAWPFLLYKKTRGIPLVLDVHGTIDEMIQFNRPSVLNDLNYAINVYFELSAVHSADVFVGVSQKMVEVYRARYKFLPSKVFVLPIFNSFQSREWTDDARTIVRQRLSLQQRFVFVYSGGTQSWQCVPETIRLYSQVLNSGYFDTLKPLLLILVWDNQSEVERLIHSSGIPAEGFRILSVAQKEVAEYLFAADVGLLIRENLTTNLVSSPTKASEYLAAGLPLLCTPFVGDISSIVQQENIGYILNIWKEIDFVAFAEWCRSVSHNRQAIAQRAIDIGAQYFSGEDGLGKLTAITSSAHASLERPV